MRASIGSTFSGSGSRSGSSGGSMRWIIQFLPPVLNRTYLPRTRSPWKTTMTSASRHFSTSKVPRSKIRIVPAP